MVTAALVEVCTLWMLSFRLK